ncbi:MAG: hypothetical protein PVI30_00160 [Myxococcales bacterium]|jgi:hypothetical protein
MRISNSFSEGEIQVMDFIVQTLLRGGTPSMATRHKEFASLCRKVMAMKAKVNERNRQVPEESSVGTVSSPHSEAAETAEAAEASEPAKTGSDDDLATAV